MLGGGAGAVFFVDDNFIGDRGKLKREVLTAMIDWMEEKGRPFYFYTEASIDRFSTGRSASSRKAASSPPWSGCRTALRGTRLHQRLHREGRLLGDASGNNTAVTLNFVPRMEPRALIDGYRTILDTIYSPNNYYQRVIRLLREYRPPHPGKFHLQPGYIGALFKSIMFLGVIGRERLHFWKLFFWSLIRKSRLFPLAITYAIYGFHFRKVAEKIRGSGRFDGNDAWDEKGGYV